MRFLFILSAFLFGLSFSSPATAQESSFCGVPDSVTISPDTIGHCDIYQRQLAYREEYLKMKEQMKARQESFATPRREAIARYVQDLEDLNTRRGSDIKPDDAGEEESTE